MKPSGVGSSLFVPETPYCLRGTNKFEPTEFLIFDASTLLWTRNYANF